MLRVVERAEMLRVKNSVTGEDNDWKNVQSLIEGYEELLDLLLDDNTVRENFQFILNRGSEKTITATYEQWEMLADLAKRFELVVEWVGASNPFACKLFRVLKGRDIGS